ncbi:MotA/TolQ/ExbB proton channel domain-containing protein [Candidatus Magnetomoraceae bacterium gMMP-15]
MNILETILPTIQNLLPMNILIEFLSFIFRPHSDIAVMINSIIINLSIIILLWAGFQFLRITVAYIKFSRFRACIKKAKELTQEDIEELSHKFQYKNSFLLQKIAIVNNLKDDKNAMIDSIDHIDANLRWLAYGITKYPTGSLIVLGLLGTVWGLQKAIYHLLPTIQSELNLENLKEVMIGTLSGMQTAFATTLAGLFCSIILGFLISIFLKGFLDRYIAKVKFFLIQYILPVYSVGESDHSYSLASLTKKTNELKKNIEDIVEKSDLLFQPIIESADNFKIGMDKMFSAAHTFVDASDSINDVSSTLKNGLQSLSDTLKEVKASLSFYNNAGPDIEAALKNLIDIPKHFEQIINLISSELKIHKQVVPDGYNEILNQQLQTLTKTVSDLSTQAGAWKNEIKESAVIIPSDISNQGVTQLYNDEAVNQYSNKTFTDIDSSSISIDEENTFSKNLLNIMKTEK